LKELYLLSGLGADKRVFDFLDLRDYKLNFIDWKKPDGNESLDQYASRLKAQITANRPVLIGVSFGGIVALEIGKLIKAEKIILISSAKGNKDIPGVFRFAGAMRLDTIVPSRLLKTANPLLYWFFGVRRGEHKAILKEIIQDTDTEFLKWAVRKIVTWTNELQFHNVVSIHGTKDRLLPHRNPEYSIKGGGHLMIMERSAEITRTIRKILE
jgi:pimeloyl-ACP methyl ester carboxylesterase